MERFSRFVLVVLVAATLSIGVTSHAKTRDFDSPRYQRSPNPIVRIIKKVRTVIRSLSDSPAPPIPGCTGTCP